MSMSSRIEVSEATRDITLSLNMADAKALVEWLHQTNSEPPYAGKLLYGAVLAISEGREYGGH